MESTKEFPTPILQETRRAEKHPFQELLYGLRDEGLRVSTDEWLDLQKVLDKGKVGDLDEMYFVSRAVLVKDIADYAKFDTVFGKLFFDIEPPSEDEDFQEDDYEEPEESDENQTDQKLEVEQKERENIEEVQESTEQESEETHGGNEATKDIENSPNAADQGMQKNLGAQEGKSPESKNNKGEGGGKKQENSEGGGNKESDGEKGGNLNAQNKGGGKLNIQGEGGEGKKNKESGGGINTEKKQKENIKSGKGGYSAKDMILEGRHNVYDKSKVLNYEQFNRVLAKLVTVVQDATEEQTQELDAQATVVKIAKNAGAPELVWREEVEEKPKIMILFDVGGSTDNYRPIMEKLFAASVDVLDAQVFYFHNAPYGDVWPQSDGNYGKNFVPLDKLISKNPDAKIIIVGDAWMADYELWGNEGEEGSGIDSLKKIRKSYNDVVWVNPIMEKYRDEMDESGTIGDIQNIFPMFELTLDGIGKATEELMQR